MPTNMHRPILVALLALLAGAPTSARASDHPASTPEPATTRAARPFEGTVAENPAAGEATGTTADHAISAGGAPVTDEGAAPAFAPGDTTLAAAWGRWLDALQASVAERTAAGRPESAPLYPLDTDPASAGNGGKPYRHLAIAKAITELESAPAAARAGGDGEDGHVPGGAASPLLALANARNYLNLSEYTKALEWYGQAAARDADGNFRRETGRESLAAAICARDTAAAGRAVAATLAFDDPAGREAEIVLAFRWLLNRGDKETLSWLLQRTDTPAAAADGRVVFWRAYALSWLDRRDEALGQLRLLLAMGNGRGLSERERGWALTATADLLLMQGAASEAGILYGRLAHSELPSLRQWGQLQSAGLDFVGHRYADASSGYREVCQADRNGPWGAHACAMADIAAQLDRLMSQGGSHGAEPRQ